MTGTRRPLLAANWKMHKTRTEAREFVEDFLPRLKRTDADVVLCPAATPLAAVARALEGTAVGVAAQNMHEEQQGPYTGEVSAPMLIDVGATGVVLGHSERRELFGETDAALARKVPAALAAQLQPILCVGETEAERDAGETQRKLRHQVQTDLAAISVDQLPGIVIAYEPIWAIGTGRTASPEQAQEAVAFVRALLGDRDPGAAERVRILYGGSVKASNAEELLAQPDVDGALVGGASLDPAEFAQIVAAAPARG